MSRMLHCIKNIITAKKCNHGWVRINNRIHANVSFFSTLSSLPNMFFGLDVSSICCFVSVTIIDNVLPVISCCQFLMIFFVIFYIIYVHFWFLSTDLPHNQFKKNLLKHYSAKIKDAVIFWDSALKAFLFFIGRSKLWDVLL